MIFISLLHPFALTLPPCIEKTHTAYDRKRVQHTAKKEKGIDTTQYLLKFWSVCMRGITMAFVLPGLGQWFVVSGSN